MQDRKVFGQRVSEDNNKECQNADREDRDLAMRHFPNLGLAFLRKPTGAEKCVAETESNAAKNRKRREPADLTAGILTVGEWKSFHQCANSHPLYEGRDQATSPKPQIPHPPLPLPLLPKPSPHPPQNYPP